VLGDVDRGIIRSDISSYFMDSNVFTKNACRGCWAKYSCSGGCQAEAYFSNGSIREPDPVTCEMQKKRIECAIYLETEKY
jgi:uncharacterized protein